VEENTTTIYPASSFFLLQILNLHKKIITLQNLLHKKIMTPKNFTIISF
jgi:hypothetical protein